MRKLILLLVAAIIFSFTASFSFAQESIAVPEEQLEMSPSTIPTPTLTSRIQTIEYALPYPGLLPDNPLYFLKAARDRIVEFLISDPGKKAEFYLLASDKRVNTGNFLIQKNKDDMGVLYISKSNNYMSMAEGAARLAGERGKATLQNIRTSIKKHMEVIKGLEARVDKNNRTKLQYEIKRLEKMDSTLQKK